MDKSIFLKCWVTWKAVKNCSCFDIVEIRCSIPGCRHDLVAAGHPIGSNHYVTVSL